ncbi:tail protein X [Microvirga alba]|uniref:Tail protein X n=1 Tax=Microvirga alba TaxID=2791025 RepID=A0A931FSG7_9HYPH|nr:tail protein X [Microvirga alba]MBF9235598.1 tail protein X [Microvirga alba]
MATTYTTREGDTVDFIAWKFYGSTENQVVEAVLAENRGLADKGALLPPGLQITLPEIQTPAKSQGVRLWD